MCSILSPESPGRPGAVRPDHGDSQLYGRTSGGRPSGHDPPQTPNDWRSSLRDTVSPDVRVVLRKGGLSMSRTEYNILLQKAVECRYSKIYNFI